jgi:mono/diheme cytochrome c family protein
VCRNIAGLAALIGRDHASAFGMWIKAEALQRRVGLVAPSSGIDRLEFAARQILPNRGPRSFAGQHRWEQLQLFVHGHRGCGNRIMQRVLVLLPAALVAATLAAATPAAPAPNGGALYARCAACHTATGNGIPGAYPPLGIDFRKLAAKPGGRRFLVLSLTRGLSGAITIEGKPYRGTMPAQTGMDDAALAAVLNHVGTAIAKTGPAFRPFTATEVAKARVSGAKLGGVDVAKLHSAAGGG